MTVQVSFIRYHRFSAALGVPESSHDRIFTVDGCGSSQSATQSEII
jgi:hypothetical protein